MSNDPKLQPGEFCCNELITPDPQKAGAFYAALFGWATVDHPIDGMSYTLFMRGEKSLAGMMQTPADQVGQVPAHWMSYVCVDDMDKSLEKAKNLGANVTAPKVFVECEECIGWFAIIQDPTGAHIALWQTSI